MKLWTGFLKTVKNCEHEYRHHGATSPELTELARIQQTEGGNATLSLTSVAEIDFMQGAGVLNVVT